MWTMDHGEGVKDGRNAAFDDFCLAHYLYGERKFSAEVIMDSFKMLIVKIVFPVSVEKK